MLPLNQQMINYKTAPINEPIIVFHMPNSFVKEVQWIKLIDRYEDISDQMVTVEFLGGATGRFRTIGLNTAYANNSISLLLHDLESQIVDREELFQLKLSSDMHTICALWCRENNVPFDSKEMI